MLYRYRVLTVFFGCCVIDWLTTMRQIDYLIWLFIDKVPENKLNEDDNGGVPGETEGILIDERLLACQRSVNKEDRMAVDVLPIKH